MSVGVIRGRVWKFGDDINTDLMLPARIDTEEEQMRAIFAANRPGWVDLVRPGDFIVGGRNYGVGSGRPASRSLRNVGVACLIADSINGLFFRMSVNYGLLNLECAGVSALFEEGQTAEVTLADFTIRNVDTGKTLKAKPVPPHLLAMMQGGGVFPTLEKRGLIAPEQPKQPGAKAKAKSGAPAD